MGRRISRFANRKLKMIVFFSACILLTVLISKIIIVKSMVIRVEDKYQNIENFRSFDLSPELIEKFRFQNNMWQKKLALSFLYPGNKGVSQESLFAWFLNWDLLSAYSQCINLTLADACVFPVRVIDWKKERIDFENSWGQLRNYGGTRIHEGCDLMPSVKTPGYFEVISASDGVVEQIGWLRLGGYRVGIRSNSGSYFYYAHLDSYSDGLKKGDRVVAGQGLGWMGNTGYGPEGTSGKFETHLHFGIYIPWNNQEMSVNPYSILVVLKKQAQKPQIISHKSK